MKKPQIFMDQTANQYKGSIDSNKNMSISKN